MILGVFIMNYVDVKSIGIYNSQISFPDTIISKKREVINFELELPIATGGISFANQQNHKIKENLIILAKPGQVRYTKFPYKCYYIHFSINDEYFSKCFMNYPTYIELSEAKKYQIIFDKICKLYISCDKTDILILNSLILELLYMLLKNIKNDHASVTQIAKSKIASEALAYIDKNISSDLCLKNVASYVHLSPNYFHNVFKHSIGKNFQEYIEEKRLENSIYLLQSTNKTLTEIAYDCGFSSQSYFSYVFKKKMGTTPREYVQKLNNLYEI